MKTCRRFWVEGICLTLGLLLIAVAIAPADDQPGKDKEALLAAYGKGKALNAQGRYTEAIQQYEQALALAPKVFAREDVNTATLMNNLAELYSAQGQYAKAEPLFMNSLRIYEVKLGKDDLVVATSLQNLATLWLDQGRYAKAEPLFVRSLEIRQAKLGKDHRDVAAGLNHLALLCQAQGRYDKAEQLFLRSLQIFEAKLGKDHPDVAAGLNNLAELYRIQGLYGKAKPLYLRSLQILRAKLGKDHPDVAAGLNNLAGLYQAQGQYAKAELLYERSLKIREAKLGTDHPDVAESVNNLAGLYWDQGQYAKAVPLLLHSLQIYEAKLGKDHPHVATSLNNVARLYQEEGQYAKAERFYLRSLEIREARLGKDHPDVATSLDNLAQLYKAQGQCAKAESFSVRSLEIREAKLGKDHPDVADSLNELAALYGAEGQYGKAEPLFLRSLQILEAKQGKDHPNVATNLSNLALTYASLGRWGEAAATVNRARSAVRQHVTRTLFGLSEREQLIFLQTHHEADFDRGLSMGLEQRSDATLAALSAGWLLNGKAVAQEVLAERARLTRAGDPKLKQTADQLLEVRQRLAALTRQLPEPGQEADYRRRLEKLGAEEERLFKDLGRLAGETVSDSLWVELDAVRRALPANAVLIDIARFDVWNFQVKGQERHWQPPHYVAWVIPPQGQGDVQLIDLGKAEPIDAAVQQFRRSMPGAGKAIYQEGEADAEALLRKDLHALSRRLLTPLLPIVGKYERWLVSPDASLWLVPWAALPLADGRYLVEKHRLSYLVSGRDLVRLPAKVEPGPALVLADPDFDLDPDQAAKQLQRVGPDKGQASGVVAYPADARVGPAWPPLFGTAKEVAAITPPLTAYLKAKPAVHVRAEALETLCKSSARPRVLVLCTHGYFLPDPERKPEERLLGLNWEDRLPGIPVQNPLDRCGLVLAGANQRARIQGDAIDDGVLTGREVVQLDLRGCELVVLSACDTGVGDVRNGEGVAGLRQAFQLAGAQSVVASLWKVPDRETATLMARVWQELAESPDRSEALRRAQLAVIKARREGKEKAAHPCFWAAFTLTGQWQAHN